MARPGETREVIARYRGRCAACGGAIHVGDRVLFYPATGRTYGPCCADTMRAELDRVREAQEARAPTSLFGGRGRKL